MYRVSASAAMITVNILSDPPQSNFQIPPIFGLTELEGTVLSMDRTSCYKGQSGSIGRFNSLAVLGGSTVHSKLVGICAAIMSTS